MRPQEQGNRNGEMSSVTDVSRDRFGSVQEKFYLLKHALSIAEIQALKNRVDVAVGERVTIIKSGTQTGKTGVVINPRWNGYRVKIKMDSDKSIKSYANDGTEFRKRGMALIQQNVSAFQQDIKKAVLPKTIPGSKTGSYKVHGSSARRGEEGKYLTTVNDNLSFEIAEETLLTEDLVTSRSHTYLLLCFTAFIGLIAQVWEVELLTENKNLGNSSTDSLKWFVTATTLMSLWLLYVYYKDELTYGKSRKTYAVHETLLSSRQCYPMLLEMLLIAIHPLPTVYGEISFELAHAEQEHSYSYDALFSLIVVGRTYLLYRGVHYWLGFETTSDARMLATLNHVKMGPQYTFKHIMDKYPFAVISSMLFLLLLLCAYALRIAERVEQTEFAYYGNALWCVFVTLTTVGYGDFSPVTHFGRMVAVVSMVVGTCLVALLVAAVDGYIRFTKAEVVTRWALYKTRLTRRVRNQAARVIVCMIKVGNYRGRCSFTATNSRTSSVRTTGSSGGKMKGRSPLFFTRRKISDSAPKRKKDSTSPVVVPTSSSPDVLLTNLDKPSVPSPSSSRPVPVNSLPTTGTLRAPFTDSSGDRSSHEPTPTNQPNQLPQRKRRSTLTRQLSDASFDIIKKVGSALPGMADLPGNALAGLKKKERQATTDLLHQVRQWRAVNHEAKASRINEPLMNSGGSGSANQTARRFANLDRRVSTLADTVTRKTQEHNFAVLKQLQDFEEKQTAWQQQMESKMDKLADILMMSKLKARLPT